MKTHKKNSHTQFLKNALVFPATFENIGSVKTIQGIQTKLGKKDPKEFGFYRLGKSLTSYKKRKECIDKQSPQINKGRYLYLGTMFTDHFGHFLAESIHRLWACKYYETKVKGFIILSPYHHLLSTKTFNEVCKFFNVNNKKLILTNHLSEFEELIVPELGSSIGINPKNWYLKELSKIANVSNMKDLNLPKKLIVRRGKTYLSRTVGSSYFALQMKKNGYTEFFPELHSLKKQLAHLVSAEFIVWEEGSACHLLEMLPKIKYKQSILIKRRPTKNAIDVLLAGRLLNSQTYKNVKKIYSGRSCDVSIYNNPAELHSFLRLHGVIGMKQFNYLEFKRYECKDYLIFLYYYLKLNAVRFAIHYIKPYINKFFWELLKKYLKILIK